MKKFERQNRMFRKKPGFTIIEIMIVVLIIVILISILIPAIGTMRERARAAATRSRMGTISTGLEQYKSDVGFYPPSSPGTFKSSVTNKNLYLNSGSSMLSEALIGYLGYEYDGAGVITPAPAPPLASDPDDFGWRKVTKMQGNKYGPYTDQQALPKVTGTGTGTIRIENVPAYTSVTNSVAGVRMIYLDAYANEILYYRATDVKTPAKVFGDAADNDSVYIQSDNATLGTAAAFTVYQPENGSSGFFNNMLAGGSNTAAPSTVLGRGAYMLISPHKNGTYCDDDDIIGPQR
jgi:prepilin-type N-terminal cleavage/methylation domain-containing protein